MPLLLCSIANLAIANVLAPSEPVSLEPGSELTHIVDWQRQPGVRMEVKLIDAPPGARLVVDQSGELLIRWQTDARLPEQTNVVIVARDIDSGTELDRVTLTLLRREQTTHATDASEYAATSPHLAPIDQQSAQVGERWSLTVDVNQLGSDTVNLQARGLPDGATMSITPDGNYDIDWIPSPEQLGDHDIVLRVVDTRQPELFTEQEVFIKVDGKTVPVGDEPSVSANLKMPQLASLSNQIISTGRVLSVRVKPTIEDGAKAILQVDRLPRNASFDENKDGSRTFYWQTSDKDQGEHLFRFTATHPEDPSLIAWREMIVIVGDPSRSATAPADAVPGAIE